MGAEEFGGYTSLLIEAWLDPDGSLPDDDEELRLLARMDSKQWGKHGGKLRALFTLEPDGRLHSHVVDTPRNRAITRSQKARDAVAAREAKKQNAK